MPTVKRGQPVHAAGASQAPEGGTACVVCQGAAFRKFLGDLRQCVDCGHVTAPLDEAGTDFTALYAESYFQGGEYFDYPRDQACYEKNFRTRLKDVRRYCAAGRLVEIGSAYGFFLNVAQPHYAVTGYELCPEAAAFARRQFALDIRSVDFLQDTLPEESCDIIAMWDVIEHLPNPQDFIARSFRLLKKGGVLALTTGDIASAVARRQGRRWRLIHPPTHVHYFSRASMVELLRRNGFEVAQVTYPGYWRTVRQIFYSLLVLRPHPRRALFNAIDASPFARVPIYLNTFDIMQVIARK